MATVLGLGVTGVAGATGIGCAGLVGAGSGRGMQGLLGACGVVVVVFGTVLLGLTLHLHRCRLMRQ